MWKLIILAIAALSATPALAAPENGRALHEESCTDCHMMADHSALYTSKERKVDSLHALGGQVSRCTQVLDVSWFPDEERDVVEYLNGTFYRFTP